MARRHVLTLLLSSLFLLSGACITTKPRSQAPTSASEIVQGIPVRTWGDNTCGSAALSAVLNRLGDPVTEAELDRIFKKGKFGGVVSIDLLIEARRRGYEAKMVKGDTRLVEESLREGKPLILMLRVVDTPGQKVDLFHYIIVDGIDPQKKLWRTHFGDAKIRWARQEKLERSWAGAGYATLIVEPGSGVNPPGRELLIRNAVLLEERGKYGEAIAAYEELLRDDPRSTLAWINLGNVAARAGDAKKAEDAYRHALQLEPHNRDALNNYAWFLLQKNERLEEAESLARRAIASPGADPYIALDTLGQILAARNQCAEAVETLRQAAAQVPANDPGTRTQTLETLSTVERKCAG